MSDIAQEPGNREEQVRDGSLFVARWLKIDCAAGSVEAASSHVPDADPVEAVPVAVAPLPIVETLVDGMATVAGQLVQETTAGLEGIRQAVEAAHGPQ